MQIPSIHMPEMLIWPKIISYAVFLYGIQIKKPNHKALKRVTHLSCLIGPAFISFLFKSIHNPTPI